MVEELLSWIQHVFVDMVAPYHIQEFYSQCFSLHVLFNMDTQSNPRIMLKPVQEQEDRQQPRNERDRAWRAAETAEQGPNGWENGGRGIVPGMLLKLLVKTSYFTAEKYLWMWKNSSWDPQGERNKITADEHQTARKVGRWSPRGERNKVTADER